MSDEKTSRETIQREAAGERESLQRAGAKNVPTQEQAERKWRDAANKSERQDQERRRK